jgi:uncharacterized membrane protein
LAYVVAIPIAFLVPWLATVLFTLVALIWFIPDRRIERELHTPPSGPGATGV